jgi:NADPH:quinone reductase-like Zn-dependent oxidoreductase
MRTYELRGRGLDTLTLAERPIPRPGPGQVLVRMHAASLNYRDLLVATGRYGRGELRYPLVPLSDGAGEVVDVGSGVTRLAPKDRVASAFFQKWVDGPFDAAAGNSALGGAIDGVLSEYVVLEEAGAVKFPDFLSYAEAATLPCAAVTAWVGLMELGRKLGPDQVLLTMGTGGVSVFALQLAKALGARVIATSSHDAKLARVKELGADHTINYRRTEAWDEEARKLTQGRGVDALLEVGGEGTLPRSLRAVRDDGQLVLVGLLTGNRGDPSQASADAARVRVDSVYVGSVRHFEHLNAVIERAQIQPVIDRVFPFESAPGAYRHLESGAHFGKIVIRV